MDQVYLIALVASGIMPLFTCILTWTLGQFFVGKPHTGKLGGFLVVFSFALIISAFATASVTKLLFA